MIEEWLTNEKRDEIAEKKKTIITAEMVDDEDGKPTIIGCVMGNEALLCLLTSTIIEKIASVLGITYPEAEERVKLAHTWSASQKAIDNLVKKYEGGTE